MHTFPYLLIRKVRIREMEVAFCATFVLLQANARQMTLARL